MIPIKMPPLSAEEKVLLDTLKKARRQMQSKKKKFAAKIIAAERKVTLLRGQFPDYIKLVEAEYSAAQSEALRNGLPTPAVMALES